MPGFKGGVPAWILASPLSDSIPTTPNPVGTRCPSFHRSSMASATGCFWHQAWPRVPAAHCRRSDSWRGDLGPEQEW